MDSSAKVLIIGGVLNFAYGLLVGLPWMIFKMRTPEKQPQKYLRVVHISTFLWGSLLISLSVAMNLSQLSAGWELAAAILMVTASVSLNTRDTYLWLNAIEDEFVQKPLIPQLLGVVNILASIASISIVLFGIVLSF